MDSKFVLSNLRWGLVSRWGAFSSVAHGFLVRMVYLNLKPDGGFCGGSNSESFFLGSRTPFWPSLAYTMEAFQEAVKEFKRLEEP